MRGTLPDIRTRRRILKSIKRHILKHHINVGAIDYGQWATAFDDAESALLSTTIKDVFEAGVQERLEALHISHVMFYDKLPNRLPVQYTLGATLQPVKKSGDRTVWGFLEVFFGGPAHECGILPGQLLVSVDGVGTSPPVLPTFAIGGKHRLIVADLDEKNHREIDITVPKAKPSVARPPIVTPVPLRSWFVRPRIAVLKVGWFPGFAGIRFSWQLAKIVESLKQEACAALIVDLRGNPGGSVGFVSLVSYLCAGRLPIGYVLTPQSLAKGYGSSNLRTIAVPNLSTIRGGLALVARLGEYSFKDKSVVILTQGLGPQPFHGRVVILTDMWTSSAAEIAAAFAKEHGLATIVGTKTAGKVLSSASVRVGGGYWLRLPFLAWYSWPEQLIEGVGVSPHISIDADPELLACGSDPQLSKAIEILSGRMPKSLGDYSTSGESAREEVWPPRRAETS